VRNDLGTMRRQLRRRGDAPAGNSRGWIPAAGAELGASGPSLRTRISHGCSIRAEYAVWRSWFSRVDARCPWDRTSSYGAIVVTKKADATSNIADAHGQASATGEIPALTPEERHRWIAKAAYLRAAARGFVGGDPLHDWLAAEAEVNASVERESAKGE